MNSLSEKLKKVQDVKYLPLHFELLTHIPLFLPDFWLPEAPPITIAILPNYDRDFAKLKYGRQCGMWDLCVISHILLF